MSEQTKRFAQARKSGQRWLPAMERYLLTVADERSNDSLLHVSDLTKNDWCPRMLYYRIKGVRPQLDPNSFQFQNIVDYGSDVHDRFQTRWWDMGVLWGKWYCHVCRGEWLALAPDRCPSCLNGKFAIRYREVPLAATELSLVGNSDGEVRDDTGNALMEIKTVGEGTFRIEAPKTYARYQVAVTTDDDGRKFKYFDIAQLWRDLNRPLSSHARQGQTYVELRRRLTGEPPVDAIGFFYQHKGNQGLREFEVLPDADVAGQVLRRAETVKRSVDRGVVPRCTKGRDGCKLCTPYEEEVRRAGSKPQSRRRPVLSGGLPI